MDSVRVFAPATVANLGPGFDVLGLAVTGPGDVVEARCTDAPGVVIEEITGDDGRLAHDPAKNTAGVAATEALRIIGAKGGVALRLHKNMPLGSGLGSSAASAAAAAWAVAMLHQFENKSALMPACLAAEASVSGYHADNVAPALLGGMVLIKGYRPLQLQAIPVPQKLVLVLVTPKFELPTAKARSVVPQSVPLCDMIINNGHLAAMIAACFGDDAAEFGKSVVDAVVEPARAALIPAFSAVKSAALGQGAFGCSISGAGPTIFAVCDSRSAGKRVGNAMRAAFSAAGLESTVNIAVPDMVGARRIAG